MSKFSNLAKIEEETIAPGDLDSSVSVQDYIHNFADVADTLARLNLAFYSFRVGGSNLTIHYTVVESKRGDTREAAVYAFVVSEDESKETTPGSQVALTLASGLRKANWLSRDVYILFIPKAATVFGHGVRAWLADFYRSDFPSVPSSEKPIIRTAFALDLTGPGGSSVLIEVEGINGMLSNMDISNVFFDIHGGVNFSVRPVFDSIAFSAMNGAVHSVHAAFQDFAIPAISLRRDPSSLSTGSGPSALSVAQALSTHVRSLTALFHQFHHSTNFFLYTDFAKEVSLGFIVPILVGMYSPLFPGLLALDVNNEPFWVVNSFTVMAIGAILGVGGVAVASFLFQYRKLGESCSILITGDDINCFLTFGPVVLASLLHLGLLTMLSNRAKCDAGSALKASAQQMYSMVITMLLLFHYSGAVLATVFVVPALTLVSPIRGAPWYSKILSIAVIITMLNLYGGLALGTWILPFPRGFIPAVLDEVLLLSTRNSLDGSMPVSFVQFLRQLSNDSISHWKSPGQLTHEFLCIQGLALVNLWIVIFPALLLSCEIALCDSRRPSGRRDTPDPTSKLTQNAIYISGRINKTLLISSAAAIYLALYLSDMI